MTRRGKGSCQWNGRFAPELHMPIAQYGSRYVGTQSLLLAWHSSAVMSLMTEGGAENLVDTDKETVDPNPLLTSRKRTISNELGWLAIGR